MVRYNSKDGFILEYVEVPAREGSKQGKIRAAASEGTEGDAKDDCGTPRSNGGHGFRDTK